MPEFSRKLTLVSPYMRGPDVLHAQRALRSLGYAEIEADGLFGRATAGVVKGFQSSHGIESSGDVDQVTWSALFADKSGAGNVDRANLAEIMRRLVEPHQFRDSISWAFNRSGIATNGQIAVGTAGLPVTVQTILRNFAVPIEAACNKHGVPVELVVATIATESRGNPLARRQEPGFVSDVETPHKVSIGLMQTLLSTAREATKNLALTALSLSTRPNPSTPELLILRVSTR